MRGDGGRWRDPVFGEDGARLGEGGRIGHGRARGDHRRVVAGDVGNGERHHLSRRRGGGEPAALDGGEVLAHAVDLADGCAALEQRPRHGALVVEAEAGRRQRHQRRAAARGEEEHEIVRAEPAHAVEDAFGGAPADGVRHRMARLDHLDAPTRHAMAIAGDDEAGKRPRPVLVDRLRHRRRGLAGADHDGAPARRRRQVRRHHPCRVGSAERRAEQRAQERTGCVAAGKIHGKGQACRSIGPSLAASDGKR